MSKYLIHYKDKSNKDLTPLDIAANISLDSRLGERGLGKECRYMEFRKALGGRHNDVFEESWTNPPKTWPEIEELARKLMNLRCRDVLQQ